MAGTSGTTGADANEGRVKTRLRAIRVPLLSGLAGGLVVAVFGTVAISAGWVAAAEPTEADSSGIGLDGARQRRRRTAHGHAR